jgi:hypothetical protein
MPVLNHAFLFGFGAEDSLKRESGAKVHKGNIQAAKVCAHKLRDTVSVGWWCVVTRHHELDRSQLVPL